MSTIADPAKLKVVELRAELSVRGLEIKGNKPVLVQRLRRALEAESGKDLPDTSIADTSTEDINTSAVSQPSPPSRRRRKASEREPSPEPAPPESPPEEKKSDEQSETTSALEEDTTSEAPAKVQVEDKNMEESLEEEKEVDSKSPTIDDQESSEEPQEDTSDITKEAEEMIEEEKIAKESEEESKEDVDESKDVDMVEELPVESNKSQDDTASEKEAAEPRNRKSRWGSVTEAKDTSDQSDAGNQSVPEIPGVTTTPSSDETSARGEKRRHASPSPERSSRRRSRSPPKEDEPDIDADLVQLSWIDSDLNLQVDKENFTIAEPMHSEGFGYMWAGARSTHGVNSGKVWYEVKLLENCEWKEAPKLETKDRKHDKDKIETKDKKEDKPEEAETKDEKEDPNKSEIKDTDKSEIKDTDIDESSKESKETESEVNKPQLKEDENADEAIPKEEETHTNKTDTEDNGDDVNKSKDNEENVSESTPKETDEDKIETDVNKLATTEDITSDIESDEDESKMEIKEIAPETIENETKTSENTTEMEVGETLEQEQADITQFTLEHHHILRIGWSLAGTNLQLGEQPHSYAYDSEGFAVTDSKFTDYAIKYSVGDVIGTFLNFDTEDITITYTVNGELQPVAFTVPRSELPEDSVLFPHVLTRNIKFEVNYGGNEEPWFQPPAELEDYVLVKNIEEKVIGISRPEKRPDCEVVMLVGLPCSGKTQWVNNHVTNNPDKKYNVLGVSYILDKMKFQGKPRKEHFNASATVLLDKCTRCLNKLIDLASSRRRNYILDQTNLFSSAQRRKMRPFDGFRRHAVVIVVTDDEQTTREKSRQQADGKDVPDSAVLEMKANMSLPSVCDWLDEVTYAELDETKANETVQKYNKQGREAGYGPNYTAKHSNNQRQKGNGDRRGSTGSGGQWNRNNNSGRDSRDRNNRWSGSSSGHSHNRQNNWGGGNRGSGNYSRQDNRSHHGGGGGGGGGGGYNRNNPNNRMMPGRGGGGGGGGGFNRNQGESGYNRNRNQPPHRNPPNKGGNWSGNGGGGHGNWSNQGNWNNHGGWGHQAQAQASSGPGWTQGNWGQFSQSQSQQWKGNYGGAQQFQQQQQGYPQGYVAGQYGGQQYPNWNYYGQYAQGWNAQAQGGVAGENTNTAQYNQYSQQQQAAWAQYAQNSGYGAYGQTASAQGANTVSGSSSSTQPATK